MEPVEWLFVWVCAAVAAGQVASALWKELRKSGDDGVVRVNGRWHGKFCLVARYPRGRPGDAFPWCTCAWRDNRGKVLRG